MATAKATANERNTRREEYMVHALSLMQASVPKAATLFYAIAARFRIRPQITFQQPDRAKPAPEPGYNARAAQSPLRLASGDIPAIALIRAR